MQTDIMDMPEEDAPKVSSDFHALPIPIRSFSQGNVSRYYIHKEDGTQVTVDAETATEALKLSGLTSAKKIVREIPGKEVLIEFKRWLEAPIQKDAVKDAAAAPADAAPPPPPAEGQAANATGAA